MKTTSATSDSAAEAESDALDKLSHSERAEIVAWVKKQYRKTKDQRHKQERQWYLNLAFYFGRQNVTTVSTSSTGTQLYTPKAPYWRARPVINRIRPIIRKELSKLMSSEPTAYVAPASSEDRDLFAAQAGESIWRSLYEQHRLQRVFYQASFWAALTGTGFVKAYWDPTAVDETNNMPGNIVFEPETPFHIFVPDLTQINLELQPYLIHASLKNIEWAKLRFGQYLTEEIRPTGRAESIMDTGFMKMIGADDPPLDSVEVVEMWVKPGQFEKFPLGCLITLVGDQLAQYSLGWPYQHARYPFAMIQHIESGGFYAESSVTDLISLQREYNRTRGQMIEAKNRMAKPQLMAPKGSVNPNSITTEPGQVILYRPGFNPPQPLPMQPLPQYVTDEIERIKTDMDDISGQHEVSRGDAPPGVTAATAISYLQEQDDTMITPTVRSIEEAMQKVAQMTLNYVIQFWDAQRMVKVTGTDGSFDVITLMGADLNGNTDIQIEKDSALPTSRAAKQAFIMDLMKMGFVDPNRGLELLEIGGVNKLYEQLNVDKRQAQRENLRLQRTPAEVLQGMQQAQQVYEQAAATGAAVEPPPPPVPVNAWDNHQVHIEVHNNFRKSQTFEALPDPIKQAFQMHVAMHEQALQAMMMAAQTGQPLDAGTGVAAMLPTEPVESGATIRNEGVQQ